MIRPAYRLVVASEKSQRAGAMAVIGHHIRSKPEEIARHCLANHRAINEDVATVAESIALADRIFARHRGVAWARLIEVEIPVFELSVFRRPAVVTALTDAIHFLTGDTWRLSFVKRPGHPLNQKLLPFEEAKYRYVMPYSDGLDSFAQGTLLEREVGVDQVLRIRSARIGHDSQELQRHVLRVPRNFGSMPKKEQSYRSRSFVFFSFAGIGAYVANSEAVVVGESGQGALGPSLVRYAGEWPFRSAHPGFVSRIELYLSLAFGTPIRFQMPQLWRTKSEVLLTLRQQGVLGRWKETSSCSVRPNNKHGADVCGICGGCMLRALATHSAGLSDPSLRMAFDPFKRRAVALDGQPMSQSERHMVARSIGSIAELAKLQDSPSRNAILETESSLFLDSEEGAIQSQLNDLVSRHASEWRDFVSNLPGNGWAQKLASQL